MRSRMVALLAVASFALLATLSAAAAPDPQEGNQPQATPTPDPRFPNLPPGIPTPLPGRTLPFMSGCAVPEPKLRVDEDMALMGREVGWLVEGVEYGSSVGIEVRTILNDTVQYRGSVRADNPWCFAMGSFRVEIPDLYVVMVRGTSVSGEPMFEYATVMGILPSFTPVPIPTRATRPEPPDNFRGSRINDTTIRLDWTDKSNDETGFRVTRFDLEGIGSGRGGSDEELSVGPNIVTLNFGGLDPNSRMCFVLWAFNEVGSTFGGITCGSTRPPRTPQPLRP